MHAMFFANGPAFKEHTKLPPFSSVDLYNLFCAILGIDTVPNNGTIANVAQMLVNSSGKIIQPASIGWSSGKMAGELWIFVLFFVFFFCWVKSELN